MSHWDGIIGFSVQVIFEDLSDLHMPYMLSSMPSHIVRLGNRVAWFLPDPGDRLWRCFLGGSIRWMLIFADGKSPAPAVDIVNVRRYNKLEYIYWIKYNLIKVNILPHPQNCSVLTCSNHTKLVKWCEMGFLFIFVFFHVISRWRAFSRSWVAPRTVASGQGRHEMITGVPREIRQENFPHNHVNPQTKEINRLGRARQSGSQCDAKGSQCEFSYVVLPRLINDEFFKMIQDQMWQFVEICHMTFLSNYSVLSETVQRICFHTSFASCFQDLAALPWK